MLFVVLLLVVAAGGVLVGAVVTGHPQWAWGSVVLSTLAAVVLVVASARGRVRHPGRRGRHSRDALGSAATGTGGEPGPAEVPERETQRPGVDEWRETADTPESAQVGDVAARDSAVGIDVGGEPAEEDTDAADVLVVSELETPVAVIDERPRYHLEDCGWASRYDTIPLPVREARELGFTPCGYCEPDATLAAHRRTPG
ncbi:hypothetical protein [Haloactinomyces albus]|uniref:Uncharacterized protein n=1 Tax=Haloactinomyces albus TaxID=1352928 RepID=A0AAE3ZAZ7_9ACTN|nr:hypothetical protein [Haloactinomyces albus]MDR7300560.1 hypothetical protein [Haloactinomyces albus]